MLDTIVAALPIALTPKQMRGWKKCILELPDGKTKQKYIQECAVSDGAPGEFTYYPPNDKYPAPMFLAQVSIPKLLDGNNVTMVLTEAEIESAIQKANSSIAEKWWLPRVDLGEGELKRIDAAYNHPVGERISDYIAFLSRRTYPGRKTSLYRPEGVVYQSSPYRAALRTSFYDKWKECHLPIAYGMLRQESSVRRPDYIERMMGLDKPTLRDVKISWLREVLRRDLERLRISEGQICSRHRAFEVLVKKHGFNRAMQLFGYLVAKQELSSDQISLLNPKKRTIQRWEKQIAEAGITPMLTNDGVVLAPLTIDPWTAKNGGDW